MPDLRKATAAVKRAERTRDEQIYRAHLAGNSLRAIAMESDLSHETVRVVIERMASWVEWEQGIVEQHAGGYGTTMDQLIRSEKSFAKRRAKLEWLTNVNRSDS